jgi:hypothetical protein
MIWRLHEGLGIPAESLIKAGQEHAARGQGTYNLCRKPASISSTRTGADRESDFGSRPNKNGDEIPTSKNNSNSVGSACGELSNESQRRP